MMDLSIVIVTLLICITIVIWKRMQIEYVFGVGCIFFMVIGIISPEDIAQNMANRGVLILAAMYIIVGGIKDSGIIRYIVVHLLGKTKNEILMELKIMLSAALLSPFANNTPIVAIYIPVIQQWAKKYNKSLSRYLIPLSYAAMLGGMCTVIGSSTNVIINGILVNEADMRGMYFFEPALIGIFCIFIGITYMLVWGRKQLPESHQPHIPFQNTREYLIEMILKGNNPIVGKSIADAGLKHLDNVYLIEIVRQGQLIQSPSSKEILQANDLLIFVGIPSGIVDLQKQYQLVPSIHQAFNLENHQRYLYEAVVSPQHPLLGVSIKKGEFRHRYNAVVLAVARQGLRIKKKIGDIVLKAGDTLLLESHEYFLKQNENSRDFLLVSYIDSVLSTKLHKTWLSISILLVVILLSAFNVVDLLFAVLLGATATLIFQCCTVHSIKEHVNWSVLAAIIASLCFGTALVNALDMVDIITPLSQLFLGMPYYAPYIALASVYILCWIMTECMTNTAAAVLVLPITFQITSVLGVHPMPFIMCVMVASSTSFSTPFGYQTNMMVYGVGKYRYTDFLRVGLPLNLLLCIICTYLIPQIWSFY